MVAPGRLARPHLTAWPALMRYRGAVAHWWASRCARSAAKFTLTWKVAYHHRDARPLSPFITAHRSVKLCSRCFVWPGNRCSPTNAHESDKAAHSATRLRCRVIPAMRTGSHSRSANTANLGDELVSRCGIVLKLIWRFCACRREQLLFKVHHNEPSFAHGRDRFKRSDMCAIQAAKAFAALQGTKPLGGRCHTHRLGSGPIDMSIAIWFRHREETGFRRPVSADGRADGAARAVFPEEPRQAPG